MYFNKLLIKDFGKFHNKEIVLKPGVNVLHGKRHAGKSTVGDFMYAMMYGISSSPETEADDLRHQKPMDGRGFTGKAYLQKDETNYLVERSFSRHNAKTQVMEVQSGRVKRLPNKNSLYQALTDVDRKTYGDALYIRPCQLGGNQAETLNTYVTNLATTGSANLNRESAVATLKKKKSTLDVTPVEKQIADLEEDLHQFDGDEEALEQVEKQIAETKEELSVETARRKREARKLIDTSKQQKTEEESDKTENSETPKDEEERVFLDADLLKDYAPKKKLTERLWFIALVGLFVVGVIAAMVYMLPFDNGVRQLFIVCTCLFVILTIVDGLHVNGMLEENQAPSEEEFKRIVYELERKNEAYEEVEIDMGFAKRYMDKVEDLQATKNEILQRREQKQQMQEELRVYKERKRGIEREIQSVNLAVNTIRELSQRFVDQHHYLINNQCADIMTTVTGGKYQDAKINSKLRLQVKRGGTFVDIAEVGDEDFPAVRLAIHIAVAKELCRDKMPVIIDGLPNLPEQQLLHIMECIKAIPSDQVLILSDNRELVDIVRNSGFDCTTNDIA